MESLRQFSDRLNVVERDFSEFNQMDLNVFSLEDINNLHKKAQDSYREFQRISASLPSTLTGLSSQTVKSLISRVQEIKRNGREFLQKIEGSISVIMANTTQLNSKQHSLMTEIEELNSKRQVNGLFLHTDLGTPYEFGAQWKNIFPAQGLAGGDIHKALSEEEREWFVEYMANILLPPEYKKYSYQEYEQVFGDQMRRFERALRIAFLSHVLIHPVLFEENDFFSLVHTSKAEYEQKKNTITEKLGMISAVNLHREDEGFSVYLQKCKERMKEDLIKKIKPLPEKFISDESFVEFFFNEGQVKHVMKLTFILFACYRSTFRLSPSLMCIQPNTFFDNKVSRSFIDEGSNSDLHASAGAKVLFQVYPGYILGTTIEQARVFSWFFSQ